MHDHHHPPAIFIADSTALDFLNSIATPVDTPVDWIGNGEGLLAWLAQAGLVPAEELAALRKRAMPGELDGVAAQARALREWFRGFVQHHMGRPLTQDALRALEPLNRLLERDESYTQIEAPGTQMEAPEAGSPLQLRVMRRWRSPESLLLPIGEALAKFVGDEDLTYVKACEGARCTLLFADHTRGHRRRWCSTAVCGNRAKVAAHRQRAKEAGAR
ncbi:MAG TPA: ABATE domain-containing protein [Bordetella sp.]|nr:ABATE domain-containing protein [Bordetella sp.]